MFSVHKKIALITGAASGIGLAVARRLATAGASIIAVDLNGSEALAATGADFRSADVSCEETMAALFAQIKQDYGQLDILINNAGIAVDEPELSQLSLSLFERVMRVNVEGVLLGLRYGAPLMAEGGRIINTASLAAFVTVPAYSAYAVSKAAVVKLSQQAAIELGPRGITVNAVCPGTTRTPMEPGDSGEAKLCQRATALGRIGEVADLAGVYHFLASPEAAYISGQAICVDGGWLHGAPAALLDLIEE